MYINFTTVNCKTIRNRRLIGTNRGNVGYKSSVKDVQLFCFPQFDDKRSTYCFQLHVIMALNTSFLHSKTSQHSDTKKRHLPYFTDILSNNYLNIRLPFAVFYCSWHVICLHFDSLIFNMQQSIVYLFQPYCSGRIFSRIRPLDQSAYGKKDRYSFLLTESRPPMSIELTPDRRCFYTDLPRRSTCTFSRSTRSVVIAKQDNIRWWSSIFLSYIYKV